MASNFTLPSGLSAEAVATLDENTTRVVEGDPETPWRTGRVGSLELAGTLVSRL